MYYTIMNSDRIRKKYKFPLLTESNILEKTLTRVGAYTNPNNIYFGSNKDIEGTSPSIDLIYQDMLNSIKEFNNLFLIKSEYLYIPASEQTPIYDRSGIRDIGFAIISLFAKDVFLRVNKNVLITPYWNPDGSIEAYYTAVGFNPMHSFKYFANNKDDESSMKTGCLIGLTHRFFGSGTYFMIPPVYATYNKSRMTNQQSIEFIKSLTVEKNPYADIPVDQNLLDIYKSLKPAVTFGSKDFKNFSII